jgi:hypothetical protein
MRFVTARKRVPVEVRDPRVVQGQFVVRVLVNGQDRGPARLVRGDDVRLAFLEDQPDGARGVAVPPEAVPDLLAMEEQARREAAHAVAEYRGYVPETLEVAIGGDSHRWYVWPDREPPECDPTAKPDIVQDIAAALHEVPDALRLVARIAVESTPARGLYTVDGLVHRVRTRDLLDLLRQHVERIRRAREDARHRAEEQARRARDLRARGGALVATSRCWECGRQEILGMLDESGRVVRMPHDLHLAAQDALRERQRRSYERAAAAGPPASVGVEPDPADPFDFVVIQERYCGC